MEDKDLKERLNQGLGHIVMSEDLKVRIRASVPEGEGKPVYVRMGRKRRIVLIAAAISIFVLMIGNSIANDYKIGFFVDQEPMKALDMMKPVKTRSLENVKITDKVDPNFSSYDEVRKALGVPLLDSWLAVNNPHMRIKFSQHNQDYTSFEIFNYIVGDVKNLKEMNDRGGYSWEDGELYKSPIILEVTIVHTDQQIKDGLEFYFVEAFEFLKQYKSKSGLHVNLFNTKKMSGDDKTIKYAVFVKDGIMYKLSGCISYEVLQFIIESMEYRN